LHKQISSVALHILGLEPFVVGIASALGVVSERFLYITVGIALLFWLLRWLTLGWFAIRTPLDFPLCILVIMLPITLWATALPSFTQLQVLRLLSNIALFYVVSHWVCNQSRQVNISRLLIFTFGLSFLGLLLALIAPISIEWPLTKLPIPSTIYQYLPQLISNGIHPNVMAGTLVMLLPIPLAFLIFPTPSLEITLNSAHARPRWLWHSFALFNLIAVLAMMAVLILTQSRGALLALATVLCTLCLLRWPRSRLLLLVFFVVVILLSALQPIRLQSLVALLINDTGVSTTAIRVEAWSRAWYMLQEFPFTGIGMGTYKQVADLLYPFFTVPEALPHAHNLLLQVGVDLGLPGLIAYLALLINLFAMLIVMLRTFPIHTWQRNVTLGATGSVVAMLVHGLWDAVTWGTKLSFIPWLLFALITLLFLSIQAPEYNAQSETV